jgi:CubicO group peptidase (beta-lactamase class C family)
MSMPQSNFGFLSHSPGDPLPAVNPEDVGFAPDRLARIRTVLEADVAAEKMPGGVLAIVRRGKLAYLETYGFRDKAAGVAMTADSLFNIASMTKPVTAVAAMQLVEQGKLMIDDPVSKYFPKFADMKVAVLNDAKDKIVSTVPAERQVTLHDLMRHTSGLIYGGRGTTPVHKMYPEGSGAVGARMSGAEFLDKLAALPLLHQPGKVWDYGFGLDVLGLVIEQVAGKTLGEVLRDNIFAPLGMNDTGYLVPKDKAARYAAGLNPSDGPFLHDCREPLKFECGGACLASTAMDYMRFAVMMLNRGKFARERVLARKTVEYMVSNHIDEDTVENRIGASDPTRADYGFGLGVAVRTRSGIVPMLGSPGEFNWPGAGGTNWWADPREDMAVVYMSVTPGPVRWHYRRLINALVYQAIEN